MTAHIREPSNSGQPWLPDYTRNVERAINDATGDFDTRLTAIEAELMALADNAAAMADALASMERMAIIQTAALKAQTHLLANIEALSRGLYAPNRLEEGNDLIRQFMSGDKL